MVHMKPKIVAGTKEYTWSGGSRQFKESWTHPHNINRRTNIQHPRSLPQAFTARYAV